MKEPSSDRLRRLLQSGDPAGDDTTPTADELAAMRREILRAEAGGHGAPWLPVAIAATLIIVLGLLLLPVALEQGSGTSPDGGAGPGSETALPAAEATGNAHQIQFATENGTQVIWVVNPDLEL